MTLLAFNSLAAALERTAPAWEPYRVEPHPSLRLWELYHGAERLGCFAKYIDALAICDKLNDRLLKENGHVR